MQKFYIFFILFLGYMCPFVVGQEIPQLNVEKIFQRFDRNQDNQLTQQEVPPIIWQRISRADFNRDGVITRQELEQMRQRLQKFAERQNQISTPISDTKTTQQPITNAFNNPKNWLAYDAGNTGDLETKGYFGVVSDGRYVYYVPCRMQDFHGIVLRYDTQGDFKEQASWASYDAGKTDGLESRGYAGAVFDGRYVYFVPFAIKTARHAIVLRYDTKSDFYSAASWSAYNAQQVAGQRAMGFTGAVCQGRYVYFVPFGYAPYAHGYVIRLDTQGEFKNANSWKVYDASKTDGLKAQGFYGAASDQRYIYFAPFNDGQQFHGRVLRYDTQQDFNTPASWSAYDASQADGLVTVGYKGAIFDGQYMYFVPFRNNENVHTKVLRYNTKGDFKAKDSWSAYDASNISNLDTRGYVGAIFDRRYIYYIPYSGENNIFHARFLRYDTQGDFKTTTSWTAFDAGSIDGLNTKGYKFGAYDGKYLYFAPYNNNQSFSGIALRFDTTATK